jgi:N utilization substance protein A
LKPAEITGILLSAETKQATVVVPEDQLSLAIGKRGQNVRLASKLIGWDIDILTEQEYSKSKPAQESRAVSLETEVNEELTTVSEQEKSQNEASGEPSESKGVHDKD